MDEIAIEVVFALPERQRLVRLSVPAGTSLREAVGRSGIAADFPGLDLSACPLGIFGRVVVDPEGYALQAGDRIELYRPLLADPKEVRKQRAARAAQAKGERG